MHRTSIVSTTLASLVLASVLLLLPAWANGAEGRATDSLQIHAVLDGRSSADTVDCPPGTPAPNECWLYDASGVVPGLGTATLRFTLVTRVPSPGCEVWSSPDLTLTVATKGRIDLAASNPTCQRGDSPSGSMALAVKSGSGIYAGARGDGTLAANQIEGTTKVRLVWEGSVTVPGLRFDTTAPTMTGLTNRTVEAATAKGQTVSYIVTAADAVDGSVPATCLPRSGSLFKVGRTAVVCSATDSSGNVARGTFTVTVGRTASSAASGTVVLKATLTGAYLHTTSNGTGTATVTVTGTKVCWKLAYRGLDQAGDSGIHIVPPPPPGKHKTSVFPFTASTSTAPGCVARTRWGPADAAWIDRIVADPSHFYVIVATKKYPQGAIGGPLHT